MSLTDPDETWEEAEARWERNRQRKALMMDKEIIELPDIFKAPRQLQLVINKSSRKDITKKLNKRILKELGQ